MIAVASALGLALLVYGTSQMVRRRSASDVIVAVLPFTNMDEKAEKGALGTSLRHRLVEELQRKHPAHVSVNNILPLHIDYVLQGSLSDDEQHVHVCVQLIRMADQNRVWTEDFDKNSEDPKLESELAVDIAQKLQPTLDLLSGSPR